MTDKTLAALACEFSDKDRPIGTVLGADIVLRQALLAARKYAGYGPIGSLLPPEPAPVPPCPQSMEDRLSLEDQYYFPPIYGFPLYPLQPPRIVAGSPLDPVDWVTDATVISQSEWAIIRPLFLLYVEREQAIHLEASRNFGVDVFGRSSAEIQQDIDLYEERLPNLAFSQPVITV
jgi:hypothetical protein